MIPLLDIALVMYSIGENLLKKIQIIQINHSINLNDIYHSLNTQIWTIFS